MGLRGSLVAALVIGLAGILGAALLFGAFWILGNVLHTNAGPANAMDHTYQVVTGVGLGAFLSGLLGWWLLAAKRPSPMRGLLVGTAAGVAAHPACWFLILLFDGSGWKDLLVLPLLTGAFTLIIVGWVTVPLPALAGFALGRWYGVLNRSGPARGLPVPRSEEEAGG